MEKNMLAALAACIAADAGVTVLPRDVMIIKTDVRTLEELVKMLTHDWQQCLHDHGCDARYVSPLIQFYGKPECQSAYSGKVSLGSLKMFE